MSVEICSKGEKSVDFLNTSTRSEKMEGGDDVCILFQSNCKQKRKEIPISSDGTDSENEIIYIPVIPQKQKMLLKRKHVSISSEESDSTRDEVTENKSLTGKTVTKSEKNLNFSTGAKKRKIKVSNHYQDPNEAYIERCQNLCCSQCRQKSNKNNSINITVAISKPTIMQGDRLVKKELFSVTIPEKSKSLDERAACYVKLYLKLDISVATREKGKYVSQANSNIIQDDNYKEYKRNELPNTKKECVDKCKQNDLVNSKTVCVDGYKNNEVVNVKKECIDEYEQKPRLVNIRTECVDDGKQNELANIKNKCVEACIEKEPTDISALRKNSSDRIIFGEEHDLNDTCFKGDQCIGNKMPSVSNAFNHGIDEKQLIDHLVWPSVEDDSTNDYDKTEAFALSQPPIASEIDLKLNEVLKKITSSEIKDTYPAETKSVKTESTNRCIKIIEALPLHRKRHTHSSSISLKDRKRKKVDYHAKRNSQLLSNNCKRNSSAIDINNKNKTSLSKSIQGAIMKRMPMGDFIKHMNKTSCSESIQQSTKKMPMDEDYQLSNSCKINLSANNIKHMNKTSYSECIQGSTKKMPMDEGYQLSNSCKRNSSANDKPYEKTPWSKSIHGTIKKRMPNGDGIKHMIKTSWSESIQGSTKKLPMDEDYQLSKSCKRNLSANNTKHLNKTPWSKNIQGTIKKRMPMGEHKA